MKLVRVVISEHCRIALGARVFVNDISLIIEKFMGVLIVFNGEALEYLKVVYTSPSESLIRTKEKCGLGKTQKLGLALLKSTGL